MARPAALLISPSMVPGRLPANPVPFMDRAGQDGKPVAMQSRTWWILALTRSHSEPFPMPSLFRFLTMLIAVGGIGYGAVYLLANFVSPHPREMTVSIPPDKFLKRQ